MAIWHLPGSIGRLLLPTLVALSGFACTATEPVRPSPIRTASPDGSVDPGVPTAVTIRGFVFDSVFGPLPGATVRFTSHGGTAAVTGADGAFVVSGTAPLNTAPRLEASAQHFETRDFPVQSAPGAYAEIRLVPLDPIELTGNHSLTIEADAGCPGFAPEARSRTYAATFSPTPVTGTYSLVLSGNFIPEAPPALLAFSSMGQVGISRLTQGGGESPALTESLGNGYVEMEGTAQGPAAPGARVITLPFDGIVSYCSERSAQTAICAAPAVRCRSTGHRLTLTRP